MNIQEISKQINYNAHAKGFWDKGVDVPEKLMLIVSEVSEAMEADRVDKRCLPQLAAEVVTMGDEMFERHFKGDVKDTFEDELADTAIRIFDLAYEMGIDLSSHIEAKIRYNATRPKMHGGKKY